MLTLTGLNLIGGVLSFLASRDLFLTTLEWMAQDTQYRSLAYNLGRAYTGMIRGQEYEIEYGKESVSMSL